jgi:hypothetical protein
LVTVLLLIGREHLPLSVVGGPITVPVMKRRWGRAGCIANVISSDPLHASRRNTLRCCALCAVHFIESLGFDGGKKITASAVWVGWRLFVPDDWEARPAKRALRKRSSCCAFHSPMVGSYCRNPNVMVNASALRSFKGKKPRRGLPSTHRVGVFLGAIRCAASRRLGR